MAKIARLALIAICASVLGGSLLSSCGKKAPPGTPTTTEEADAKAKAALAASPAAPKGK